MSAPDPTPSDDVLDEAAAVWLSERDEGFSPERARAFAAWRLDHPRHEAAVKRVEDMFLLLNDLPTVRAPLEERLARKESAEPERRRIVRFPVFAWAAGLAAAFVIGWFVWYPRAESGPDPAHYMTASGTQSRVGLSDGSLVYLNSASDVLVDFNARERRVVLSAGEAHFEVAHDASRPFIVVAGGVSVRAVGTAFNVKLAAGSIDVLVVQGKVEVARQRETAIVSSERPLIAAGEQTRVLRDQPTAVFKVEKVTTESIREQLAWQDSMIPFVDIPLRDIVTQFNRRNLTQIVVGDPELGDRKVGGMIALDQIEAFVRMLEYGGDIAVERRAKDEIVLRRAR